MCDELFGEDAHAERASLALPILVRQAEMGQSIYYKNLGCELGGGNRIWGRPLGRIGDAMRILSHEFGHPVPQIQSLVIKVTTGLPGEGFDQYLQNRGFGDLDRVAKRRVLREYWGNVFGYPYWDDVLQRCGLDPHTAARPTTRLIQRARRPAGGEGEDHRVLKDYVRKNASEVLGLRPGRQWEVVTEHRLPSGDRVDVLIRNRAQIWAVEVKPASSDEADIARGFFQCIKYRAVLAAEVGFLRHRHEIQCCLALGSPMPRNLVGLRNALGVTVIENVRSAANDV